MAAGQTPGGPCGFCGGIITPDALSMAFGYSCANGTSALHPGFELCFAAGAAVTLDLDGVDDVDASNALEGTWFPRVFTGTAAVRTDGTRTYDNAFGDPSDTVRKFYGGSVTLTPLDAADNPIGGTP